MAMAQVTDNPAIADGSPSHQQAKQLLHQYILTYVQTLIRKGKQLDLNDILYCDCATSKKLGTRFIEFLDSISNLGTYYSDKY